MTHPACPGLVDATERFLKKGCCSWWNPFVRLLALCRLAKIRFSVHINGNSWLGLQVGCGDDGCQYSSGSCCDSGDEETQGPHAGVRTCTETGLLLNRAAAVVRLVFDHPCGEKKSLPYIYFAAREPLLPCVFDCDVLDSVYSACFDPHADLCRSIR